MIDPDRELALNYVPKAARARIAVLWALDEALSQALSSGRDRMIARIKLAWWRDSLEALDAAPAPAQPVLQGVAAELLPLGVTGAELARLEEGWSILAHPEQLDRKDLNAYAAARGATLFALAGRLLGEDDPRIRPAGELWALTDLARRASNPAEARLAMELADARVALLTGVWPVKLRPIGMLALLAARDLKSAPGVVETQGSPSRMLRMVWHRLSGR